MKNILFVCTGESCRLQIAEGFARKYLKDRFNVYSAGINPLSVDPECIKVMDEIDIDISNNKVFHLSEVENIRFDYVVTLCDSMKETCPIVVGELQTIHRSFPAPEDLADGIDGYKTLRDTVEKFIKEFCYEINNEDI